MRVRGRNQNNGKERRMVQESVKGWKEEGTAPGGEQRRGKKEGQRRSETEATEEKRGYRRP